MHVNVRGFIPWIAWYGIVLEWIYLLFAIAYIRWRICRQRLSLSPGAHHIKVTMLCNYYCYSWLITNVTTSISFVVDYQYLHTDVEESNQNSKLYK